MTARIWTEPVLRNVFGMLKDGYDYGEIGELLGVTRIAVRSRVNQTWVGPAYREWSGRKKTRGARFWTKSRRDEVASMYRREIPAREIAKHFGVSLGQVKKVLTQLGIADRSYGNRISGRKGQRHAPEAIEKMRQKAKARFQCPAYRARHLAAHSPEIMRQRQREWADKRRGGPIPAGQEATYQHLTATKKIPASEAYAMVCREASTQATGGR